MRDNIIFNENKLTTQNLYLQHIKQQHLLTIPQHGKYESIY